LKLQEKARSFYIEVDKEIGMDKAAYLALVLDMEAA